MAFNCIFPGEPAARTLYRDGSYIFAISGAGAIRIKNNEIIQQLVKLYWIKTSDVPNSHILFEREGTQRLTQTIFLLFNNTLGSRGNLPDCWKLADVKPKFLNGKKIPPGTIDP